MRFKALTKGFAMRRLIILSAVAVAFLGCNMRPSLDGESGELGRGVFYYNCVNITYDSACFDTTETPNYPEVLAEGAMFDMEYALDLNDGYDTLKVIPASPNHVSEAGGVLTLEASDFVAIFSVEGPNQIVDIVHILGMPITDMAIVGSSWDGGNVEFQSIESIELEVGQTLKLRGVAMDDFGRALAGLIRYDWTVGDEEVIALGPNTTDSVFTLEGLTPGATTLIVDVGGSIEKEFLVEVTAEEIADDEDDHDGEEV